MEMDSFRGHLCSSSVSAPHSVRAFLLLSSLAFLLLVFWSAAEEEESLASMLLLLRLQFKIPLAFLLLLFRFQFKNLGCLWERKQANRPQGSHNFEGTSRNFYNICQLSENPFGHLCRRGFKLYIRRSANNLSPNKGMPSMSTNESSPSNGFVKEYQVHCQCNLQCVLYTSRKGRSYGKKFLRCPQNRTNEDCGYFKWLNDDDNALYDIENQSRAFQEHDEKT